MAKTYAEVLADIKAQFGIADDVIDKKLQRLIEATNGAPLVEDILRLLQQQIQPANIIANLTGYATELADLINTGKSVPKKNRSALGG